VVGQDSTSGKTGQGAGQPYDVVQIQGRRQIMKSKERIHNLLKEMSIEVLNYIRSQESSATDRWVPAANIKNTLELNFVAVPKSNKQYGEKG